MSREDGDKMNLPKKEPLIPNNHRLVSRLQYITVIHQLTKAQFEPIYTIFTFHHDGIGHLQINTNQSVTYNVYIIFV